MSDQTYVAEILRPSGAARMMACPGSLAMEQGQPDIANEYTEKGTAEHRIAALWLEHGEDAVDADPEGPANIDAVKQYVNSVGAYADAHEGSMLFVEQRVEFGSSVGYPEQYGTADAIVVIPSLGEIQIHDRKMAFGKPVSPERNPQLMLYAIGALNELNEFSLFGSFNKFRLVIHQPGPVEWLCDTDTLEAFAQEYKERAFHAVACLDEDPKALRHHLRPGDHCQYCKARAICPALRNQVISTVAHGAVDGVEAAAILERNEGTPIEEATDPAMLGYLLNQLPLIKMWCKALEERAYYDMINGKPVPGHKLVAGRAGNRAWSDFAQAEALLKTMRLKTEEMYDLKLISPTTAEKLAQAKKIGPRQWPKLQALIKREAGKPTIAPADDKREAIKVEAPADDFDDLTK